MGFFSQLLQRGRKENKLASDYYNGTNGQQKDEKRAVELFKKAAQKGNVGAMNNLGIVCDNQGNLAEAFSWYLMAAKDMYIPAMYQVGNRYLKEIGVKHNVEEGLRWLRKASDYNYQLAKFFLGYVLLWGYYDVKQDTVEGLRLLRQLAEEGDATAMMNLGDAYNRGCGVQADDAIALDWFRKAVAAGDSRGKELVERYEKYHTFNLEEVPGYREYAIGQDFCQGKNGRTKDVAEGLRWLKQGADKGYPSAICELAYYFFDKEGIPHDYMQARYYAEKAVAAGEVGAYLILGYIYRDGKDVEKDMAKAIDCFEKCIDKENANQVHAFRSLGYYYRSENQHYKAFPYILKGAKLGDQWCQAIAGYCLNHGEGVAKDQQAAITWFTAGANNGSPTCISLLAQCYEKGFGVTMSQTSAIKWYVKAARLGEEYAQKRLKELGVDWLKNIVEKYTD